MTWDCKTWSLLLFGWDWMDGCSFGGLRHDDGVFGMENDGDGVAGWWDAPIGIMMAWLTKAEPRAVLQREKDPQALALIDDIGDGATEAVRCGIAASVVDQQFFAVHGQYQRVFVRDGPRAAQDRRTERHARGIDTTDRQQACLSDEAHDKGICGSVVQPFRLVDLNQFAVFQNGDAVAYRQRLALVVRDVDDRSPDALVQFAQLDLHGFPELLVERRERFIHQDQARFEDDRPRKRHALALAAG